MTGNRGLTLSAVLLAVAACAPAGDGGPPTVHYGQDLCAECGMIVTEERYASAVVVPVDGSPHPFVFDDLGCLFAWDDGGAAPVGRWVQDIDGAGWVNLEAAWYVRSAEIRSPMGSGIAACASRESAEELSRARSGVVHDWNGLRELARKQNLLLPPPAASGT